MEKRIYNEKTGISYTLQGDYYLPNLKLPDKENKPIGLWGQRHARYLKQNHKVLEFFSTQEYREFYQIARNYQTRSLNVDACSVFFYGLLREKGKKSPITEKFIEEDNNVQPTIFEYMK